MNSISGLNPASQSGPIPVGQLGYSHAEHHPGAVVRRINELSAQLSILGARVSEVERIASPVLRGTIPQGQQQPKPTVAPETPLCGLLADMLEAAIGLDARLRDLASRMEL